MGRELLARGLLFVAAVLLVGAVVAGYVRFELLAQGQFADRAAQALEDPDVRGVVGREITDRVVLRSAPDLVAAKPLIEAAVAAIAGSPPFLALFEDAVDRAHAALLSGDESRLQLDLRDAGVLVESALERLRVPELERLPADDVTVRLAFVDRLVRTTAEAAHRLRVLAWSMIALALVAAGAGIALSRPRRRAVQVLAASTALVALAVSALLAAGRVVTQLRVSDRDPDRAAAGAVWDAFLGDLAGLLVLVAAFATVVAAAAATQATLPDLEPALARARRLVLERPRRRGWSVVRALALVLVGTAVVVEPLAALRVVGIAAGLLLLYAGVDELLTMARDRRPAHTGLRARDLAATAAPGAVVALLVIVAVVVFLRTGGVTAPAVAQSPACNGSVALCDRRLDEIVLPAAHNAMSTSAETGWYSAAHTTSIAEQLRAGVRGLLIDAHYGIRVGDRVRTDLSQRAERAGNADRELYLRSLGPEGFAAIQRIRDRAIPGDGEPGVFLCHRFCELGATELTSTLREILQFLVEHPREVLVIVIQDYVLPADVVAAFEESGLADRVYRGPPAGPFPTLRSMVERQQQVVVYAEHHGGAADWYTAGYEAALQDTPFTFERASLLTRAADWPASCSRQRGTADAPLFLVNHWVNTDPRPLPSQAALVNTEEVLVGRARECERLRGRMPNLLAVDFASEGALFDAVARLNRAAP